MKKCENCEHYMGKLEVCQFCDFKPKGKLSFESIECPVFSKDRPDHYEYVHQAIKKMMKQQYLATVDARIEELLWLKEKIENDL